MPADEEYDRLIYILTIIQLHHPLGDEDFSPDPEQPLGFEVIERRSQAPMPEATETPEPE